MFEKFGEGARQGRWGGPREERCAPGETIASIMSSLCVQCRIPHRSAVDNSVESGGRPKGTGRAAAAVAAKEGATPPRGVTSPMGEDTNAAADSQSTWAAMKTEVRWAAEEAGGGLLLPLFALPVFLRSCGPGWLC